MAKLEYIWAIGDVHGYSVSLIKLLERINEFNTKRIIYLGDYIDLGPEPKETIDVILESKHDKVLLMGDHELMLLNCTDSDTSDHKAVFEWSENGYETTLKSFGIGDANSLAKNIDKKYIDFFNNLNLFHTETLGSGKKSVSLLFSHAGPFADNPIDEQLKIDCISAFRDYLKQKKLTHSNSCLWNSEKILQNSMSTWDNYLLVHGHIRTQYRHGRNRLQYGDKNKEFGNEYSDIPMPLYFPGGAAISALDIDTGIDIGGKLTAVGFCEENIDFRAGKMLIKVIQVDSARRGKNPQVVVYDLTVPFTDEISWFRKAMKSIFRTKKKKKIVKEKPVAPSHKPHKTTKKAAKH
jgi:serine/threonine protein phosphatase 1